MATHVARESWPNSPPWMTLQRGICRWPVSYNFCSSSCFIGFSNNLALVFLVVYFLFFLFISCYQLFFADNQLLSLMCVFFYVALVSTVPMLSVKIFFVVVTDDILIFFFEFGWCDFCWVKWPLCDFAQGGAEVLFGDSDLWTHLLYFAEHLRVR